MIIAMIASVIRALWLVGEVLHQRGQQVKLLKNLDRNSGRLWDVANAIEPVGMILGFTLIGRIQTGSRLIEWAGLALLNFGIIIKVDGHPRPRIIPTGSMAFATSQSR